MSRIRLPVFCLAATMALALPLGGCSKGGGGEDGGQAVGSTNASASNAKSDQPLKLNIMTISYEDEAPREDNDVELAIEKYTNTKLNINYVPSAGYDEKSKVVLVSNDLPQVILNTDPKDPSFVNAVQNGAFWDLTDYIQDYPNLANMNRVIYDNSSVDGKIYGVPRQRPLVRSGFIYRKDWLDNLGLSEPQTIDDFYNVLKAFATKDPDGNSKPDTYGVAEAKGIDQSLLFNLQAWFGAPLNYQVKDGKLEPAFNSGAYMEALKFVKKLYDEKLINPDFAALQNNGNLSLFEDGKAGVIVGTLSVGNNFKELRDAGNIGIRSYVEGPQGPRVFSHSGYFGIYMISKSAVKTEDELRGILAFFDKLGDMDMQNLLKWGVEGIHSVKVNGQYAQKQADVTDQEYERAMSELSAIGGLDPFNKAGADQGAITDMNRKIAELEQSTVQYIVADPTAALISRTASEKGEQLKQIIYDANIKFIMGVIDEAGWQKEMEKWSGSGGAKVVEELTAEYQRTHS